MSASHAAPVASRAVLNVSSQAVLVDLRELSKCSRPCVLIVELRVLSQCQVVFSSFRGDIVPSALAAKILPLCSNVYYII
jgi:hypothetical protein